MSSNGDSSAAAAAPAADASTTPVAAAASPELTRLQARVASHPQEFEAWTALVSEAERLKDVPLVRQVTNGLLQQFPLCFGYWQRLAKLELAQGTSGATTPALAAQAAFAVLEAGLQAIPHSHELWTFYTSEMMKADTPPEHTRSCCSG